MSPAPHGVVLSSRNTSDCSVFLLNVHKFYQHASSCAQNEEKLKAKLVSLFVTVMMANTTLAPDDRAGSVGDAEEAKEHVPVAAGRDFAPHCSGLGIV